MKKIFTLIIAAGLAMTASAQTQYGIYADITTEPGSFMSVDLGNDNWGYGVKGTGVTFTYGKDTKYVPTLVSTLGCNPENDFNSGAFIADVYSIKGNLSSTWSISLGQELLFATGFKNGTDETAAGFVKSDDDAASRWPEEVDGAKVDYGAKDLAAIAPDYWAGFSLDVPAGQTLTVNKISAAIGGGNNFAWSIQVYNEAGERVYDSKTGFIQSGNSTDEKKQGNHIGYSADITSTEVSEPYGGTNFRSTASGLGEGYFDGLIGEAALPLTAAKIAAITPKAGWDPTSGKTPASRFEKLPEGGLKLTGKNTVRLYFGGVKNSRLFGIEHFYVEGVAATTGISSITAAKTTDAPCYNLAGQAVGKDYKGVVIKGGKKVMQ